MNIEIIDNYLDQSDFIQLQTYLMSNAVPWYYLDGVSYPPSSVDIRNRPFWLKQTEETKKKEKDGFLFSVFFYSDNIPRSPQLEEFEAILKKLQLVSLWRIKANLLTRTPTNIEYAFHVDNAMLEHDQERLKQWTTAIYYVNTNNGYTIFEEGTKVKSIENRICIFPSNMKHASATCTDEKRRVVVNFNYFRQYEKIYGKELIK